MKTILFALALVITAATLPARIAASDPGGGDWPMWGGTPDRNMVSNMKGLPLEWDVKTKKNVKWVADLGSQSYGNPVVAGGMVFVGTNNETPRDPKQPGDRGVLMAFRESTGEFLWQQTHEKLAAARTTGRTRAWRRRRRSSGRGCTTRAIAESSGPSTSTGSATARTTGRSPTRS